MVIIFIFLRHPILAHPQGHLIASTFTFIYLLLPHKVKQKISDKKIILLFV